MLKIIHQEAKVDEMSHFKKNYVYVIEKEFLLGKRWEPKLLCPSLILNKQRSMDF